jgi:hypothetical protein
VDTGTASGVGGGNLPEEPAAVAVPSREDSALSFVRGPVPYVDIAVPAGDYTFDPDP